MLMSESLMVVREKSCIFDVMKLGNFGRALLVIPLLLSLYAPASAQLTSTVVITEIQTGSLTSASQEFIELYNTTNQPIDISAWRLEYFSASAANFNNPSRVIQLHGILQPGKYYLAASTDYLTDQAFESFAATLAKTGGHVRLASPDTNNPSQLITQDLIGWGTAAHPEVAAASAPAEGTSLQRKVDEDGYFIDSNNNSLDFEKNLLPNPQADNIFIDPEPEPIPEPITGPKTPLAEDPGVGAQNTEETAPQTVQSTETAPLLPIRINELLPNPAPPATDDKDEFIELYNPNNEAVDLENYKLQSGNSFSYSHTFENESIGPLSYLVLYVDDSGLLLANSGGKARLINPSGQIVNETAAYEDADDGAAWMFDGSQQASRWAWTTTPTPNAPNQLTTPALPEVKAVATTKKTPAAKTTAVKKPVKKAKTAAAKKPKATKKAGAAAARSEYEDPTDAPAQIAPLHPMVLAGIGGLTLVYGAYEYRFDALNRLHRLRKYREARRALRQTA